MIVHLDLGDIGPLAGHMMNDRIGQSTMIGPNGGNDNLHGRVGRWFGVQIPCKSAMSYRRSPGGPLDRPLTAQLFIHARHNLRKPIKHGGSQRPSSPATSPASRGGSPPDRCTATSASSPQLSDWHSQLSMISAVTSM